MSDPPTRLVQLNVRLPRVDRDALRRLATESGVSVTGLLGAIVHNFLRANGDAVSEPILSDARAIDAHRRHRPHLKRPRRDRP